MRLQSRFLYGGINLAKYTQLGFLNRNRILVEEGDTIDYQIFVNRLKLMHFEMLIYISWDKIWHLSKKKWLKNWDIKQVKMDLFFIFWQSSWISCLIGFLNSWSIQFESWKVKGPFEHGLYALRRKKNISLCHCWIVDCPSIQEFCSDFSFEMISITLPWNAGSLRVTFCGSHICSFNSGCTVVLTASGLEN